MGCDNRYGDCGYRRGGCCNNRPYYGYGGPYRGGGPGPFYGPGPFGPGPLGPNPFPIDRPYFRGYRRPF